jgi:hypothetical protein
MGVYAIAWNKCENETAVTCLSLLLTSHLNLTHLNMSACTPVIYTICHNCTKPDFHTYFHMCTMLLQVLMH